MPIRVVLPPLVAAYAVFVAMVVLAVRRPPPRPGGRVDRSTRLGWRRVITTMVGGYVAFLVVVLIFHAWIADEPTALRSALWGGAFLCGVILVVTAGAALLERHRRAAG
jgi:threonine/homoserine/homoserine lactone efflux protein